jgi:hypothetical protein
MLTANKSVQPLNTNSMKATLYIPSQVPQAVSAEGLSLSSGAESYAHVTDRAAHLLGCPKGMVDILDTGSDYAAYSVFDYEGGEPNLAAVDILNMISRQPASYGADEGSQLYGPILIVTAK